MNRKIFLVDTENIGKRFLPGIQELASSDKIILFQNENAAALPQDILVALANTPAAVEIQPMKNHNKNAMDFQICSYLGILVNKFGASADYFIISLDKGYESAIEFIKNSMSNSITVELVCNCAGEKKEQTLRDQVDAVLAAYPRKVRKEACNAIIKSHTAKQCHNYLQNNLRQDGSIIYHLIRPIYYSVRTA